MRHASGQPDRQSLSGDSGGQSEPDRRAAVLLGVLVASYVVLIVALSTSGRFTFVWKTSVVPALVAVALARRSLGAFVRDWAVYLALLILFDSLRGMVFAWVTATERPFFAAYVIDLDRILIGGRTLPEALQAGIGADPSSAFAKTLVVVHGSHFVAFLLCGVAVWLLRRAAFRSFAAATLLLIFLGLMSYAALPTVPPWMASSEFHLIGDIRHLTAEIYNVASPTLGRTFDVNPIAAMPSLHAALPMLCSLIMTRHFGWRGAPMFAYTATVWFAIGYLGEHYLIDIVAGAVLAVVTYLLVYRSALWRVRAGSDGRRPFIVNAAAAIIVVVAAEAVGHLAMDLRGPLLVDEAFVEGELRGRSDLFEWYSARLDASRGDHSAALDHLTAAVGELRFDGHRRRAMAELYETAIAQRASVRLTRVLAGLSAEQRGRTGDLLLAWSRVEDGDRARGFGDLDRLSRDDPNDLEPLFLAAWLRARGGELHRTDGDEVLGRLEGAAREDPAMLRRAEALRGMLEARPSSG